MLRLNRWIAAVLAACILFYTIPVYTFAETEESSPTEETVGDVPETPQALTEDPQPSESETATATTPTESGSSEEPDNSDPSQENQQGTEPSQEPENTEPTQDTPETSDPTQASDPQEPDASDPSDPTDASTEETQGEDNETALTAEGLIPAVGDTFADSFIALLNEKNISTTITKGEDDVITLTIGQGQGEILALLSQQEQTDESNYQNWNIEFNFTGELPLPDTFRGLGDWGETAEEQFPFKGKFTNQAITIKTSKTLFKALDASADLHGNSINWEIGTNDATPTIPILTNVLVADGEAHTINMPLTSANRFNPYIGQLTGGAGQVTLPALNYSGVGTSPAVNFSEDVGLVCNSMAEGTRLQVGAVTLPSSVSLNLKSSRNVGSLVGSMGTGATLTITEDLTLNANLNGANAGGLVGSMTNATIEVTQGKTVTVNATLTATGAAGGIAGVAETETGPLGINANVVLQSVKANGTENSGVLYGTCAATGDYNPLTGLSFGADAVREVSGEGNCGGLFGTLALTGDGKCTISGVEGTPLAINSTLSATTNTTQYGGIAGTLSGENRKNALVVDFCDITFNISVKDSSKYLGGVVAVQGANTTVDAKNSKTTVQNPKVSSGGYGGVCGSVGNNALLLSENMTTKTEFITDLNYPSGGGIAGSTSPGSIVYLKTKLDLSECALETVAASGQIVGKQDCSLIYAPDVAITRPKTKLSFNNNNISGLELDDIGNYGELYRLQGMMSVSADGGYTVTFPNTLSQNSDGAYALSSTLDYACFALAWQSRGYFSTVAGINNENWSSLKSCAITLNDSIDLTGRGIGGLTRDVYSADDTFTGTFDGGGQILTLDIGARNVANDITTGDGRIYWHNAIGLFAAIDNNATVSNLTLAGSIRLSNNKLTSAMSCGALAAQATTSDNADKSMLTAVSTKVNFDAICSGSNYVLYLGGLFGQISAKNTTKIDFTGGANIAPKITITYNSGCTGSSDHFGGAIGAISGNGEVKISCNGATIGDGTSNAGISNQGSNNPYNMYVGGLIGTIWSGNTTRSITIQNLTVNHFTVTGSASQRMGGILGGIWAGTDVTIDGLTVSDTTLTASGAAELGGLVYRASGKWTVSSADLSGLTIDADNASALGLLVCHGEPYKEPVNATTLNTNVDGLYLEMAEHWNWNEETAKGFKVPSASQITFTKDVFDEFVAYTAYRYSDGSYDINHNGSGIISLKTDDGTVDMGEENTRNTYENRTDVSTNTNKYSRYYYNLPMVLQGITNSTAEPEAQAESENRINTAEELLIWSVYRYAASNLKKHFNFSGVADDKGNAVSNIGGTSSEVRADFDMKGLSYYPINITDESITVQYADVKFYNNEIETKEVEAPKNKTTRGETQHYTMHCALFRNFTAENVTKNSEYQMTVNGVTFAGTVGVVSSGSGALLCGIVEGKSTSGNTAICKVVLADTDEADKAVKLNGISVESTVDYRPVLINKIGSYSTLEANYVTTMKTTKAGSSLIGDVGGENATHVTITFDGTIKLPEQKSGAGQVFTMATLLNSLQYADGSGTYTFISTKDEGTTHDTTHGYELSESVEYAGKCGYYDDDTDGTKKIPYPDGQQDFKSYLPYVANSPATDAGKYPLSGKWHELAVNIHSEPLTNGCGTYGHPYQVTAKELREAANYLNTGVAFTGWQVRVPENADYHTQGEDILLTYKDGGWKKEDGSVYDGDVRAHLQSAYYQLVYANGETTITLNNFPGIGTNPDWAFKGVITGKIDDSNNVSVILTGGSSAFVKYSYGSVVRDVDIQMEQDLSLTHVYPTTTNNITAAQQAPGTFFGGVIGCVLGGDNIIENVTVSSRGSQVMGTGTYAHLVPIGGYVGVIAGGGVIFRGTISSDTGITGEDAQLYRNPVVGRVLGGYAFYEGTGTTPDNGNKDYQINTITPEDEGEENDLIWENNTLTVNTEQGLLILSAIVSSGAGSTSSNAYKNGVARNAAYDQIGSVSQPSDYEAAQKDSGKVWENANTPYLLAKYASYTGKASICTGTDSGIDIQFKKDANFDMIGYGNGYRGLSARYVSNAAFNGSTVTPSAVVLRVETFDGQNATVKNINMDVQEYNNDDFHMASMGGIFNIVWTQKQSGGGGLGRNFAQNLTLLDCNVQLKYVGSDGTDAYCASYDSAVPEVIFDDIEGRSGVSVGGFIGSANDITNSDINVNVQTSNYRFSNIHIKGTSNETRCNIIGPNAAGGLIGTTAMTYDTVKGYPGVLISNSQKAQFAPSLLNCSYENINVTAQFSAGGMIGHVNARKGTPTFGTLGENAANNENNGWYASFTVTDPNLVVGKNSTIKAEAWGSVAGGIYAATGMRNLFNAPDVDTKTGLAIKGENTIQTLKLESVTVSACTENREIKTVTAGAETKNGNSEMAAGGITARHGSQNPSWYYNISLSECTVNTGKKNKSNEYAGGIVASGYTNQKLVMEQCEIKNSEIDSKNSGGFLGYGYSYYTDTTYFNFYLSDCKIEGSRVNGDTCSGGLAGLSQGKYYFYNILIKNTSVTGDTCGRLLGKVNFKDNNAKTGFELYAAGISVYTDPQANPQANPQPTLPERDLNQTSFTGYIAYADYAGTETEVADQKAPYVTVNPNFPLSTGKTVYGDAVGKIKDDSYNSVAARIWADSKTGVTDKKNQASYAKASEIVNTDGKSAPEVSTFREVQGYTTGNWGDLADLPVLVLKGNDASAIEDYLNVITNGGYGEANVTPTVSVYYFDKDKQTFSAETEDQRKSNPASIFYQDGQFHIRSRTFDNTLNRFSLVEASFTVTVNSKPRTYTVSVPVVVIRELQFDFMATFAYGKEFSKDTYENLRTHLLESTGNPFTAYLTYQYNREVGQYVEYDWQTYMDDGGSMLDVDKVLSFSSGLPGGTQMILVDCQNGNQAYQYTTSGTSTKDVQLSGFTSLADGTTKFKSSMADVLEVEATKADDGKYVIATAAEGTVRRDGVYYRRFNAETDSGKDLYKLTVPDLSEKEAPEENYYLVITVPNQSDPDYYINGSLSSSLSWSMPSSGTQLHRYDPTQVDNRNNTESTYQISTGYRQELISTASENYINLGDADQKMQVKVQDTITFSNQQTYDDSDKLFLKLTVNLQEYTTSDGTTKFEEKQFPVGTTGTVKFYVKYGATNTYYTWNGTQWVSQKSKTEAASYPWSSNGANMELLLSADGTNALDLSGVRQLIKGSTGDSQIIVTAEMDVVFGSSEVLNAAVPASDQSGADKWAQLHYVGQISTQESSLDYSAQRATADDNAKYYRGVKYEAILSMDAALINQLGVNPLELVPDYLTTIDGKKASRINLTAALNLANLQDIEEVLQKTKSITFTLFLERRKGEGYENVTDAQRYIAFDDSYGWSWTILQEQYYKDGEIVKNDLFDGTQFTMPLTAYVFTEQTDYANYKIRLEVTFDNESNVDVNDSDAYVVYTFACIKPTFYDPGTQ